LSLLCNEDFLLQARDGFTHSIFFCLGGWEGWNRFVTRNLGKTTRRYVEGKGGFVDRYEGFRETH
jgi:hypothetical protein